MSEAHASPHDPECIACSRPNALNTKVPAEIPAQDGATTSRRKVSGGVHIVKRPVLAHLHSHIGGDRDQRGLPAGQGVTYDRDRDRKANAKGELVAPRHDNARKCRSRAFDRVHAPEDRQIG